MEITLHKVSSSDAEELRKLSIDTFVESYAAFNSEANMQLYIEDSFSRQKISEELQDKDTFIYFARIHEQTVGYIKLKLAARNWNLALEIQRIYVLKEFQGKNIGQKLINLAFQLGKEMNLHHIWLGVWKENSKALVFYEKHNFTIVGTHTFVLGEDVQNDWVMERKL